MKKLLSIVFAGLLAFSFVACGNDKGAGAGSDTFELALVTDYGDVDDQSFNQHSWQGVVKFAEEAGVSHKYYRPTETSNDGYVTSIETAINNGAKVVVVPGFSFAEPIGEMQAAHPDVKFIIVDTAPEGGAAENTYSIVFAEEQAGFLAGYAAVKDGHRKLGFIGGMAVPAVIRYGYGYAQGAEYAAQELGLADGEIEIMYAYSGGFSESPEIQARAAAWYNGGTEIIFSCGGPIINNIISAAEASEGKYVIGVDSDQSYKSEVVITSSLKDLEITVYEALKANAGGNFPGGQEVVLGVESDAVGLPMETSRFNEFSQEDYDAIYADLKADKNGVTSGILGDANDAGEAITIADLNEVLKAVVVKDAQN